MFDWHLQAKATAIREDLRYVHDLDSSVRHWLVRAQVRIPFAAIFADIPW